MPITQDRFIEIIDAAGELIDFSHTLRKLSRGTPQLLADINSVITNTNDDVARKVMSDVSAMLNTLQAAFSQCDEVTVYLSAKVLAEKQYFNRVRKSNQRAAYYQQQRRLLDKTGNSAIYTTLKEERKKKPNGEQNVEQNNEEIVSQAELAYRSASPRNVEAEVEKPNNDIENTEAYKIFQEEMEKRRRNQAAQTAPASKIRAKTIVATSAGVSYDKTVLRTSVPSLDELNEVGTTKPTESVL